MGLYGHAGVSPAIYLERKHVMLKLYKNPKNAGWMGWFEDKDGKALAFVTLQGIIVPSPV
jgi:hypothetical protein